jgi:hypothetical protein
MPRKPSTKVRVVEHTNPPRYYRWAGYRWRRMRGAEVLRWQAQQCLREWAMKDTERYILKALANSPREPNIILVVNNEPQVTENGAPQQNCFALQRREE